MRRSASSPYLSNNTFAIVAEGGLKSRIGCYKASVALAQDVVRRNDGGNGHGTKAHRRQI